MYHLLAGRRGKQRAALATVSHILIAVYHILRTPGTVYQDLGANYFDERDKQAVVRRESRRLEALGYRVSVEPAHPRRPANSAYFSEEIYQLTPAKRKIDRNWSNYFESMARGIFVSG